MVHDSLHDSTSRISDSETRAQPTHTLSAQLFESGLEVAPASEHDKQFVNHVREGDKEVVNQSEKEAVPSDRPGHCSEEITKPKSRKILGLKRIWFWSLLVALLLAIALGVGLGVGLTSKDSSESSTTSSTPSTSTQLPSPTAVLSDELKIGGSLNDSYYSSSGAWNGSGIAQVWQNFAQNFTDTSTANQHEIVVYYQDHDGDIRWLRETSNTTSVWQPGPADVAVMAEDARNSTPIAAVHWDSDGANYWHVFYIDSNNRIRQRSGSNQTTEWSDGSINKANLKAWDGDLVGIQACWAINNSVPIRLFYASDNTTFEEYLWFMEDDTWEWQRSWKSYSGAASPGCYKGGPTYRYAALVNLSNQVEFWYQTKGSDDVTAEWLKSDNSIDNVHPASSLSLIDAVTVWQEETTGRIRVSSMIWQGESTKPTDEYSPDTAFKGVPGTRLKAMALNQLVYIFYQRDGEDVTRLSRNLKTDTAWTPIVLPM